MNLINRPMITGKGTGLDLLCNGDRMSQAEFHARYQAYPEDVKFELVRGVVYMASPLRRPHALYEEELSFLLGVYRRATPGVELLPNVTTILGEEDEPQPDLSLRIMSEYGGRSTETEDKYLSGPPELLAEIAYSSRAIDLHQKKEAYFEAGILEYIVLCVEEPELHWFHFPTERELRPNREGITRSKVFLGLWIGVAALLARDSARLAAVLQEGLASKEHVSFVKRLERVRRKSN